MPGLPGPISQSGSSGADPASRSTPERQAANSLIPAALLAFSGGSVDSFVYLNHGRVFATAMTGDCVLLGAALVTGHARLVLHFVLPLFAFFAGILASEALQDRLHPHVVTVGLTCELLGLLACSFLPPGFPDLFFTPLLSFLIAYQVTSFRSIHSTPYSSGFVMNDLRSAFVGLYTALRAPAHSSSRTTGLRQSRELGLVVCSFTAGASAGARLATPLGNHTLWLPVAVLTAVLAWVVVTVKPHHTGD